MRRDAESQSRIPRRRWMRCFRTPLQEDEADAKLLKEAVEAARFQQNVVILTNQRK